MSEPSPDELERIDQEIRIKELKEKAAEAAGEPLATWEAEGASPDLVEAFWGNVAAYETAPDGTHYDQLTGDGLVLPPPDELDDTTLAARLWDVIRGLAAHNVFLSQTDHLSDRELYTLLVEDLLREPTKLIDDPTWNCHIDILGGCSLEDMENYHRYYASDEDRESWQRDFPEEPMPPKVKPPYDRDRHLPRAGH